MTNRDIKLENKILEANFFCNIPTNFEVLCLYGTLQCYYGCKQVPDKSVDKENNSKSDAQPNMNQQFSIFN